MFDASEQKSQAKPLPWLQKVQMEMLKINGISQFQLHEQEVNDGKSKRIQAQWHANSLAALTQSLQQLPAKDKLSITEDKGIIHVNMGFANDKPLFLPMLKDKTYTLRLEGRLAESNQPISLSGATELVIPLDVAGNHLLTATIDPQSYPKKWLWLMVCVLFVLGGGGFVLLRQRQKSWAVGVVVGVGVLVVAVLVVGLKRADADKVVNVEPATKTEVIAKAAPTIITGEGEDTTPMDNRVQTSQGVLWLSKVGKEEFEQPDLYLEQKMLLAAEGEFLTLKHRFQLSQGEAIIVSKDAGGTGTFPSYLIVLLQQGQAPQLLSHADFYSETHTIIYSQKGDVISMDLGLQNGLKKTITLDKGQLLVGGTQVARAGLTESNCQWLHSDVLSMCAQSQNMGSECDPSYVFEPNMVVSRGLNDMRQNANFNEKAMVTACYQACQQQTVSDYASFKKSVCGG
jgi:hypothetical protein